MRGSEGVCDIMGGVCVFLDCCKDWLRDTWSPQHCAQQRRAGDGQDDSLMCED